MTAEETSRTPNVARLLFASLALAAVSTAGSVLAQATGQISISTYPNGFIIDVPSDATYSRTSGLQLEVDTRWTDNFGYRPIRVRILSAKPATAEHRITIRLRTAAEDWRNVDVEQSFDLPLGAREAETIVACPQFQTDHRYWWDVWVDGARDKELSLDAKVAWGWKPSINFGPPRPATKFLIVGSSADSQRLIGQSFDVFEALSLALGELPMRWIDYSAFDVVVLTPGQTAQLAETRPAALMALRRWVRTGGQLWIHSLGERWQRLPEVEQLLELSPAVGWSPAAASDQEAATFGRGWQPLPLVARADVQRVTVQHIPSGRMRTVSDPGEIARYKGDPNYSIIEEATPDTGDEPQVVDAHQPVDSSKWYVERRFGMGSVRVYRGEWDPVGYSMSWRMLVGFGPGPTLPMTPPTPLTAAVESTKNWPTRHGMSPDRANEDFANLLVPGMGLAPVTEFRVLITVFVLVIGPLNYWLLKRANRLHLMLLTVPLFAFGLTSALFAYALVSDGLSTTVRVRSFTSLDQHTGEAACWSRLSYYAGLAPGEGLQFSEDVAIYPIIPGWNETSDDPSLSDTRTMEWSNGKQLLTQGWLHSRVPTQYLSVRARKSPLRMNLEQNPAGLKAKNQLGTRVNYIAAIDAEGNVFTGSLIAAGETAELKPATHADVLRDLRRMLSENQPESPPALADSRDGSLFRPRGRRQLFQQRYGLDYGPERLAENLQSAAIATLVEVSEKPQLKLPPRSYVAITETGPEVELGVVGAEEEASFHVLVGNW